MRDTGVPLVRSIGNHRLSGIRLNHTSRTTLFCIKYSLSECNNHAGRRKYWIHIIYQMYCQQNIFLYGWIKSTIWFYAVYIFEPFLHQHFFSGFSIRLLQRHVQECIPFAYLPLKNNKTYYQIRIRIWFVDSDSFKCLTHWIENNYLEIDAIEKM